MLLCRPCSLAFIDPVDMISFIFVVLRRLILMFAVCIIQAHMFQQVLFKLLIWPLSGLLLYLIRCCLHWSVDIAAKVSDVSLEQQWPRFGVLLITLAVMACSLRQPRIGKQVKQVAPTPPAVPNRSSADVSHLGSIAVVPDGSSEHMLGNLAIGRLGAAERPPSDLQTSHLAGGPNFRFAPRRGNHVLRWQAMEVNLSDVRMFWYC